MLALDVNVLVDAFREDSPHHDRVAAWLDRLLVSDEPFVVFGVVACGFVRVVTHPRVFDPPTPLDPALAFLRALDAQPGCLRLAPGPRHREIFERLCRESGASGNLVSDAYLAALATDTGCTWVSSDRDYARFSGLRWIRPES